MKKLIDVMREIRSYLARPGNDFVRSNWQNADAALSDVDAVIDGLEHEDPAAAQRAEFLFGPTSEIQEVGIPSGWGDQYLNVAARFDEALGKK